jgi:arginine N-succinyltransferase
MVFIRPVAKNDLEPLLDLASRAGAGLTNLPRDRGLLKKRIDKSVHSFANFPPERPGGEAYLFVMEDSVTGAVVGACGIMAKVGGYEPFYSYKIETHVFESKQIKVHTEVPILVLVEDHDGPCEIGSLFLHPDYRGDGNGRLLQLVRFLFMADNPDAFETTVVSELRGVSSESGQSPFWDALGAHFFGIDFPAADRLSIVNKKFIADLMPEHPIYIPLLPKSAQDVIGRPHNDGVHAMKNLENEGFKFANMVDIFDAGPVLSCARDEIRTIKQGRKVTLAGLVDGEIASPTFLISNAKIDFRACKGPVQIVDGTSVKLSTDCAAVVKVEPGEQVRICELAPPKKQD